MRKLWSEERVTYEGEFYRTRTATIYDRPAGGVPIYVAAGGPQMARYAGRVGDGFICTSGKGDELYRDSPARRSTRGPGRPGATRRRWSG